MADNLYNIIFVINNFIDDNYIYYLFFYFIFSLIFFSLSLPGSTIIVISSGFLFGTFNGFVINILSISLGSLIFISFSNFIFKKIFSNLHFYLIYKLKFLQQKSSFDYLILLRLIVGPPLILQNLLIANLNISKVKIILSTLVGFTPIMFYFAYVGNYLSNITQLKNLNLYDILSLDMLIVLSIIIFILILKIYLKKKPDL